MNLSEFDYCKAELRGDSEGPELQRVMHFEMIVKDNEVPSDSQRVEVVVLVIITLLQKHVIHCQRRIQHRHNHAYILKKVCVGKS